jgi:hypothetical protein
VDQVRKLDCVSSHYYPRHLILTSLYLSLRITPTCDSNKKYPSASNHFGQLPSASRPASGSINSPREPFPASRLLLELTTKRNSEENIE